MNLMTPHDDEPENFKALPEAIKYQITQNEWQWLSDAQKASYVQTETEPDPEN